MFPIGLTLVPLAALRTVPAALRCAEDDPKCFKLLPLRYLLCRLDSSSVFFGLCVIALAMNFGHGVMGSTLQ